MKTFTNSNARDLQQAVTLVQQTHRDGKAASFVGGGSDLLGLVKERLVAPDVLVNLKTIKGLDQVTPAAGGVNIGGLITLDTLSHNPVIRRDYAVLAEAAETVATPQIRNVGTLAGNVNQRPWCWYFRNGFPCFKNGGNTCFSFGGENQFHAIFGGGPSYIVHPSDTAVALVALEAKFRIVGPSGERLLPAADFFALPQQNSSKALLSSAAGLLRKRLAAFFQRGIFQFITLPKSTWSSGNSGCPRKSADSRMPCSRSFSRLIKRWFPACAEKHWNGESP